jgi:GH15 family glucan-1,4-alpha-glucosidase
MQLAGERDSARRFHEWAIATIQREAEAAAAAIARSQAGISITDGPVLRARYSPDGMVADTEWPNFQLDGLGIWLWALEAHTRGEGDALAGMTDAVDVVARYLSQLWRTPCFDCWEEHGDQIHVSTLAAIYGGLTAAAALLDAPRWAREAASVRDFVLAKGTADGVLRKHLGTNAVDASLMWVSTPFRLLQPDDPLMRRTADMLVRTLTGPTGGIRRYTGDSFYGGGQWVLLTAHLGWYQAELGDARRARDQLAWVEAAADPDGLLPEQVLDGVDRPDQRAEWTARWGPVAKPLLWSHASYLILRHVLDGS